MIYGYARVSTTGQGINGNSLEYQEKLLKEAGAKEIYPETFTGTKVERPVFDELIKKLVPGDTLVFTKLNRVARSFIQGSQIISQLIERDIKVNILNIGLMDNTPSSKLIRHIFFAFAEFERDMIVERTQEGKAIAKTKPGFKEGRPKKFTKQQIDHALELKKTHSYKQVSEMTGISVSTLKRA